MLLQKTDKARLELSPGVRTLSLRERSLLLLADGKPLSDLQAMYNGIGAQIVDNLMRQGYLTGPADLPPAPDTAGGKTPASPASPPASPAPTPAAQRQEPAEALRSLAGARMYLFDTCERLFARRDPVMAQQFREALRAAKDQDSMLDVGEAMFDEVALAAGAERAASLRERFEQLLPAAATVALKPFDNTQPAVLT
ncbi:hypothetical protein ASF11_15545 [Acidovorax sp. Leaf76]|uniref:hypothetical protein n=1 Tax=unclassified Acidovorax TaxID=2684926 RepID=UPI0006F2B815|nr:MULTISPECIES: hypothetical protein [unclassified Acidovorax]KQO13683.1 hypothetical protein ASF11_15545 [Acidovorax sp. Leaf76]KQO30903.1 hypothetical protein ASF19_13220 [Acidovorax sp. Leaf84]KQS27314.1 hypothetical protein ASG27_17360 [Acidovorax sp. Leaf191]